ncbi:hypothetical protein ACQKM2_12780 [Streptomyces sp. NPDC004126]|uniref:hypothetical protein n=1 Tax=Streptomyces sp. NPDC004126 TaxID=3390695 RepID=UPI003D003097
MAEKLKVPGAFVLLRTPQGTYRAVVGTTERGTVRPRTPGTASGSPPPRRP